MIILFKVSDKIACVQFVTRRLWLEFAAWRTIRSSLKGWSIKKTETNIRIVTPFFGFAVCFEVRNGSTTK